MRTTKSPSLQFGKRHNTFSVCAIIALFGLLLTACSQENKETAAQLPAPALIAAPRLGVVVDMNMRVIDLDAGGVAENAGIQVGDILTSLDGIAFASEPQKIKTRLAEMINTDPTQGQLPVSLCLRSFGSKTPH